jgi:tRNA-binding protein
LSSRRWRCTWRAVEPSAAASTWITLHDGVTGIALFHIAFNIALVHGSASQGALIYALVPAAVAIVAVLWLEERLSRRRIVGIMLSIAGVALILAVEDVPNSAKLVRLRVDFGDHTRVILAGMKGERPNPRDIEGQQALFVVNLEPKRMAGKMSEGMLFDIGYADGITPVLAVPEKPVPNGVRAS